MPVAAFTVADYLGLGFYAAAWLAYYLMVERSEAGRRTLNRVMNGHRYHWMRGLTGRDNRIIDANINASLQNGTAFFASTSLLAIGGSLTLLRSTDEVLTLFAEMPLGLATTRLAWEMKVIGLTVIFVYAFFKFAWSYRLFNYSAIRHMLSEARKALAPGRPVLIFPEGSRKSVASEIEFKRGIELLYLQLGVTVLPVALDSGRFWGADLPFKNRGAITVSYLPPIEPGLSGSEFIRRAQQAVQGALTGSQQASAPLPA